MLISSAILVPAAREVTKIQRQKRKLDHIEYALRHSRPEVSNGFEDIRLINDSLPGFSLSDVDPTCVFLGKRLAAPLLINAITGGHPAVAGINKSLARAARQTGVAMAVGSQMAGLENPKLRQTYEVARQENPDGVLLANLSAGAPPEQAAAAVEMISADGLQLYLNVPQELAMQEGDRRFNGVVDNIKKVTSALNSPVIVKEVGFGLSRESVSAIYAAGVRHVDVGGQGGTNFIEIENMRSGKINSADIRNWGIPTAVSLLEGLSLGLPVFMIASGGLETGVDVAKAAALGAGLAGMSRIFLKELMDHSEEGLINKISGIIDELRLVMLMSGAKNLAQLAKKPVLITGPVAEWAQRRGIDIDKYARR
ncbi:type 2 isopentenyl-diphosphate Delta-isomerase [Pelotomaculum terephthalicicum JT]|uniref:type 2 isopentenyl-diphosphate Delta-isomerase n=1 Tax=Pelotomaculum TaxID=191373 RepID=UPI0009D13875|nr:MULTISPECIES: type 2 isopentenyl-diphosphate Delta-isomerase [Pelotomaculum]MCG9967127.1 type 2 isopentenyl-diphosphate Delta-isomerase [Pelotomaculum terephthalicicum JT]OPX87775.1 MAG: Isopentenyl-diphosphate delta-isomerase [Pelotomaculum sp. PtaB.Bin117]OPY59423.1 MAG: Isopentenyl-diphosphate delta-isomerase [Pelotomaculum sp. PtaU1.Bin065]